MGAVDDNLFPKIIIRESANDGSDFSNPPADYRTLFVGEDGLFHLKDSAGTVTSPGGGGSGSITASGYTQATAKLLGRSTASTGAIEEITVGTGLSLSAGSLTATGGSGDGRPAIDSGTTLHATYGDDFTGASLAGKWTQRGSAVHTYQSGYGSWLRMAHASGASELIYQTAPAGDFEIIASYSTWLPNVSQMIGPMIVDSSGTGVFCTHYWNSLNAFMGDLSSWGYNASRQTLFMGDVSYESGIKLWMALKKSGTNYSFRYSHDGYNWTPYSSTYSNAFTVAYIGFGRHLGTATDAVSNLDRFNLI